MLESGSEALSIRFTREVYKRNILTNLTSNTPVSKLVGDYEVFPL